jgi:hypothetical protein
MYISQSSFIAAVAKCCPSLTISTSKVFPYVEDMFFFSEELGYNFDGEEFTTEVIDLAKELQGYEE